MVLVKAAPDQGGDGTKKKKLGHLEKSDGRRLVEYMIVVSSLTRETQCDDGNEEQFKLSTTYDDDDIEIVGHTWFKPVITARYPLYDHEDNPFDENVSYFCHTSGSILLKKEPHMPKVRNTPSSRHTSQ